MRKIQKMCAALLAGVMTVGTFAPSVFADEAAKELTDEQVINVRTTAFGNNYDVQDMGWRWMMAACYEGLYRDVADENGDEFILAGAESVDISDDGTVYTYHLREDAKWSDGVPVTAHDYEYGWKHLLNPDYAYDYASFIYNVVGAEEYNSGEGSADDVMAVAVDDYTFEVTLKVADPTFESKLVATPLYPTREDLAEAAGDNWGKDWTLCVYNGPFCMTDMVVDNKMVWTKNAEYWDAENVHLDTINWYIVAQESTAATMFENGELDQYQPTGDYAIKFEKEAEEGKYQYMVTDYPGTIGLRFNFINGGTSGLMSNVKIRKAISYSIDREEMIDAVYGRYNPAYSYVAPAITFNGSSYRSQVGEVIEDEYNEYVGDPDKIVALFQEGLDELGVETPIEDITLTYLTSGSTTEVQAEREYIQQSLEETLGLTVELSVAGDSSLFIADRNEGNYDFFLGGWYSDYNDPLDFLYTNYTDAYGMSFGGYSNTDYDALADQLVGETDMDKRLDIYKQMEQILLLDDCAFAPIYYATKQVLLQNWVKDYRTSSFGASAEFIWTYIDGKNQ